MIKILAPAKINLGLEVVGKRNDGYHLLDTIFAQINMYDELIIKRTESKKLKITSNIDIPLGNANLVWQALNAIGVSRGFEIHIEKRIPVGGGLGGGSSNAAAILRNASVFGIDIQEEKIKSISSSLGADVYYCYKGGIMRGRGTGDTLEPITATFFPKIAVLPQNTHASTKEVFSNYISEDFSGSMNGIQKALEEDDFCLFTSSIANSLESSFLKIFPRYKKIVNSLRNLGFCVQLSGSGSTFYVVLRSENDIIKLKNYYQNEFIVCDLLINSNKTMFDSCKRR